MAKLGRVADIQALAADEGARARLSVGVPESWLAEGAEIEITTPARMSCDRCGGGGCDGCARSGALRGPRDEAARKLVLRLPGGKPRAVRLRLPAPFDDPAVAQLIVTVSPTLEPDARVRRLDDSGAVARTTPLWWAAAITVAAVVAAWLLSW